MDKAIKNCWKKSECGKRTLLDLPLLVQEKIYENVGCESRKNLSRTCTFYRDLANELYYDANIEFSSNKSYTEESLDSLRETNVKYLTFVDEDDKDLPTLDENPSRNVFPQIFRFPLALQKVVFAQKADACWVFDVLSNCRNIKSLTFNRDVGITGDLKSLLLRERDKVEEFKRKSRGPILAALCPRGTLSEIYYTKLTLAYIDFRTRKLPDDEFINVICLLKSLRSETLKRFFIILSPITDLTEMEYFQVCWILGEFLEFHVKTLRDVSLGLCLNLGNNTQRVTGNMAQDLVNILSSLGNVNVQTEPNEIQGQGDSIAEKRKSVEAKVKMVLALREKFESIGKKSGISYISLEIPVMYHWDFWHIFIENLTRLCTLRLICSTNFNILKNCQMIHNSYKNLKRLRLNLDLKNPFDCAGTAECERLEEFYLFYRPGCDETIIMGPNEANVKNVHLIPSGLKSLALGNVVVATKDINKALSKQQNLDTIAIMNMMSFNTEMGCDYKSVKKVIRMRHLEACLLFQIRCKTKADHSRVIELLDFQLDSSMDTLVTFIRKKYIPGFQVPLALDISPTERCHRRYHWENKGVAYQMRFYNDDPYL